MNSGKLLLLSVSGLLLVGCGDKDEAYYLEHMDKANEKISDCEKQMMKAFEERDKDTAEKIQKNPECKAAHNAVREFKRTEREKERQEKEAKEKAESEAAKNAVAQEYGQQTWQEYIVSYANSDCAESLFTESSKCSAMKALYKDKFQQGKNELYKIPFEKLSLAENTYCKQDKRQYSVCQVWKETVEQQEKEIVENYVKNYDSLKRDYNQCVDKALVAKKQPQSWKLISDIRDSYPCQQTVKARSQLQLGYGLGEEKME